MVVEVTAKERGKYLLAGQDTMNEDPVRNLGIESDKTIRRICCGKRADHCKDMESALISIRILELKQQW